MALTFGDGAGLGAGFESPPGTYYDAFPLMIVYAVVREAGHVRFGDTVEMH